MDASNAPVRRPPKELSTEDIGREQKPAVENYEHYVETQVVAAPETLKMEYLEALKFAEEPVTIRIERAAEKFPAPYIECWCNGKSAEVLLNGRWLEVKGLPVGIPIITKRKYVEILARSKQDTIATQHDGPEVEYPHNSVERYTSSKAPFSVLRDDNPKGREWLSLLVRYG